MKKKLIILLFTIWFLFLPIFSSCLEPAKDSQTIILPELAYKSREEIKSIMDEYNIKYFFKFSPTICSEDYERDTFDYYGENLKPGDEFNKNKSLYIYTTVLPLKINNLDKATLKTEYKNKSFIDDGIGIVKLQYAVDGDTARFIDPNSKTEKGSFSVRFLGIDTPESTLENDPWGKAASSFTSKILNNAKEIVLEAEGSRTETYGRYLAFVWVDGKLLNLWIVQEAYSNSTLSSSSKYFNIMLETAMQAKKTGRRFYGEIDPNYKYK